MKLTLIQIFFVLMGSILATTSTVSIAYGHSLVAAPQIDKIKLRVGHFNFSSINSRVRVDSTSGALGALLSFEDDLNISSSLGTARLEGIYQFNRQHSINVNYYEISRSGQTRLDKDINFGDETFSIDRIINTLSEDTTIELYYRYALFSDSRFTFDIGGGLRTDTLNIELQSPADLTDPTTEEERSRVRGTLFLPVFVFNSRFNISSQLGISTNIKQFLIDASSVKGVFSDFELLLDYRMLPNIGIGFGISKMNTDLTSTGNDIDGGYQNTTVAFFSYVSAYF